MSTFKLLVVHFEIEHRILVTGKLDFNIAGFWCKCKFLGCQICFATLIDLVAGVLCLTLCCRGPKHSSCHLKKPKESYLIR